MRRKWTFLAIVGLFYWYKPELLQERLRLGFPSLGMVRIKDILEISTLNEDPTMDETYQMCGYAGANGFIKETYIREDLNFER